MKYRFLRYPGGLQKAVTLSYDDGCRQDIRLAETIDKYNLKCTFNLNSAYIADEPGEWHLTVDEIADHIVAGGHEIALHGARHVAPGKERPIDGIREMLECRLELERRFGMIIRGMAYPDSGINCFANNVDYQKIKQYLSDLDIAYARTVDGDNDMFRLPGDWHRWVPTVHHINPQVTEYIEKFNARHEQEYTADNTPLLFYLWGHSYEFDEFENWDLLEEICKSLAGRDDTWYATNIEIYDYVAAYNSLIFSADGTVVHNPTATTVWIYTDGNTVSVGPGQTARCE